MYEIKKISGLSRKIKHWAVGTVIVLVILFAFQNQLSVTVRFLFWNLEISRFALIAITFVAGLISGWLILSLRHTDSAATGHSKITGRDEIGGSNSASGPPAPPNEGD